MNQSERPSAENKDCQILYEAQAVIIHTLTAERDDLFNRATTAEFERDAALVDAKRWQTMYECEYNKVGIVAINSIPKGSK